MRNTRNHMKQSEVPNDCSMVRILVEVAVSCVCIALYVEWSHKQLTCYETTFQPHLPFVSNISFITSDSEILGDAPGLVSINMNNGTRGSYAGGKYIYPIIHRTDDPKCALRAIRINYDRLYKPYRCSGPYRTIAQNLNAGTSRPCGTFFFGCSGMQCRLQVSKDVTEGSPIRMVSFVIFEHPHKGTMYNDWYVVPGDINAANGGDFIYVLYKF